MATEAILVKCPNCKAMVSARVDSAELKQGKARIQCPHCERQFLVKSGSTLRTVLRLYLVAVPLALVLYGLGKGLVVLFSLPQIPTMIVTYIVGVLAFSFVVVRLQFGRFKTPPPLPGASKKSAVPVLSIAEEYHYIETTLGGMTCPTCRKKYNQGIPLQIASHGVVPGSKIRFWLGNIIGPDLGVLYDHVIVKCQNAADPHGYGFYFDVRKIDYFAENGFTLQSVLHHMKKVSETQSQEEEARRFRSEWGM